jgi:DNA-directed RNA polymerase subunit M/transcription elongation factor TFIIS
MKCPKCGSALKRVDVDIEDSSRPVMSYQCPKCDYFSFDKKSMKKAIKEIRQKEAALRISQRIIKLSKDRLGMYFNKNVVESLDLKAGKEVYIYVPDKEHIVLQLKK